MSTHSIHHVTAVTADIIANLRYYTGVLGLRLVKQSVNQDDVSAYHLFYADAAGTPGTDMTFFDWPTIGENVPGLGSIALTSFRVRNSSLDWWEARLAEAGSAPLRDEGRLTFSDPEGQRLELVSDDGLPGSVLPWDAVVPAEHALRGILGVTLQSAYPGSTGKILKDVLGYEERSEGVFQTSGEAWHGEVRLLPVEGRSFARLGAGGVHHVAFRVADDDELRQMQSRIEGMGLGTSGFVDRFWFHSLYFREPGGILFELATDGPGFSADEDASTLGEKLVLPPFLEPNRSRIEAGLKPLRI